MTLGDGTTWDETLPTDATLATLIDDHILDVRKGVRARMALEHEWPTSQSATNNAGQHKFITLQNQGTRPTLSGTQVAGVYTKTVGSTLQELFYENETGVEVQLTKRGIINQKGTIQLVRSFINTSTLLTGTAALLGGGTTPSSAAGIAFITGSITPISTNSLIRVRAFGNFGESAALANVFGMALFLGTTAAARQVDVIEINQPYVVYGGMRVAVEDIYVNTATSDLLFFVKVGGDQNVGIGANYATGITNSAPCGTAGNCGIIVEEILN